MNIILIVAGAVLCLLGIAMLGRSQSGGLNLRNLGVNIGSTNVQKIAVSGVKDDDKKTNPSRFGLAMSVIGFLTAVIGLIKALTGS
jgi:hypothetical protein